MVAAVNAAGGNGSFFGYAHQFLVQVFLVIVASIFAAVMTWIHFKFVDALVGMRVNEKEEIIGLDLTSRMKPPTLLWNDEWFINLFLDDLIIISNNAIRCRIRAIIDAGLNCLALGTD